MSDLTVYDAIAAQGFIVPQEIVWDGEIHRFASAQHKPHDKDGWYVAYDDMRGKAVAFGSWRQGNEKYTWSNGAGRQMTAEDWAAIEAKKRAVEAQIKATRQKAAAKAAAIYGQAATTGTSAYLATKGIQLPAGVRFVKALAAQPLGFGKEFNITGLVVPVTNSTGAIISVQFIPDGGLHKLFLPGGQTGGGFHVLGDLSATTERLAIAEGLATAQSAVEATGWPVIVAFSAGNVPSVASVIRSRHPQAEILLLGDNDAAGLAKATEAATLIQGRAVFPPSEVNDFNDLHVAQGLEAVRAILQPADRADDPLWRTELIVKPKEDGGQDVLLRLHNLLLILENTPEWRGKLALDEFANQLLCDGKEWVDAQALELKAWLEKHWIPFEVKTGLVHEAVEVIGRRHAVHPVREYLLRQRWDGIERIPTFFSDFCGTSQTRYIEAVARCLFVSAVARILDPGCKADMMLVLEGEQGCGKSRLVLTLFGKAWHSEITESPGGADFYQALRGKWCCEFGEMAAFGKADKNRIKQVLTQIQDTYRPSYGRNTRTFLRQNIFIGTTNNYTWNDDPTGARRFLPIRCGDINIDAVTAIRDQLWAEAVWRFNQGEKFHDIPDAAAEQDARFDQDAWEERIAYWLQGQPKVTILEVMENCLELRSDRQGRSEQTRIGQILRRLKWLPKQETTGDRRRFYFPPKVRRSTA